MLIYQSLGKLIAGLQRGDFSSQELVREHLEHIQQVNPHINAIVQINSEAVLAAAQQADEARAKGRVTGLLHGIPFTVKDSLETAGLISTSGTIGRKDYVPETDASS